MRHPPRFGLSARITTAFVVVLVLHVLVAVLAHSGQARAGEDLRRLEEGRRDTEHMLTVDRLVGELQRCVQGYVQTGNAALAQRSEQVYEQLEQLLTRIESVAAQDGHLPLATMGEALQRYREQFRLAVVDRDRREKLVDGDLQRLAVDGERLLADALDALPPGDHLEREAVLEVERRFLSAQNGAHRYLATLDAGLLRTAQQQLANARARLDDDLRARLPRQGDELLALLEHTGRVLIGVMQSTRGYLHLVDVVMAAEAAEFLRESADLREQRLAGLDGLQQRIEQQQADYRFWSDLVAAATIVLGVLAGVWIGRGVVQPLRAITSVLRRVAHGDSPTDIPGSGRNDEIGDMAAVALVLRERTAEARRLLVESESLSRQREAMIVDLERSNRELDSFTHIASHDLKAPLRSMFTVLRWIDDDCAGELPVAARDHLATLRGRIERMNRLLGDLQVYSRSSRSSENLTTVSVLQVLRDTVDLVGVGGHQVSIAGDDVVLRTARLPFAQVLGNLISNAIRHHDRTIGSVACAVVAVAGGVEVSVTDDGPGIPPQFHERIFEPFRTLQSRDDREGSGVGLAIVRRFVEVYAGSIAVESPVGGGRGTRMRLFWRDAGPADDASSGGAVEAAADRNSAFDLLTPTCR